jgi:hypothetical protein
VSWTSTWRPEVIASEVPTNEEEKAICRANLTETATRLTELKDTVSWWRLLSNVKREEFKIFLADVNAYLRDLE